MTRGKKIERCAYCGQEDGPGDRELRSFGGPLVCYGCAHQKPEKKTRKVGIAKRKPTVGVNKKAVPTTKDVVCHWIENTEENRKAAWEDITKQSVLLCITELDNEYGDPTGHTHLSIGRHLQNETYKWRAWLLADSGNCIVEEVVTHFMVVPKPTSAKTISVKGK